MYGTKSHIGNVSKINLLKGTLGGTDGRLDDRLDGIGNRERNQGSINKSVNAWENIFNKVGNILAGISCFAVLCRWWRSDCLCFKSTDVELGKNIATVLELTDGIL